MKRIAVLPAVIMLLGAPARAGEAAGDVAAAEELFNLGRSLMAEGKYDQACPKLEASQRLDPGAGTLLNLAGCYEAAGRSASAWATYREAEGAAARSNRVDWQRTAHARAGALAGKLVHLTVRVPDRAEGLVVATDGRTIEPAAIGVAVPIDPGPHTVAASAPGRRDWSQRIVVSANAEVTVPALEALPPAPPPPSVVAAPPSSWSTQKTLGIFAMGVGAVTAIVGGAFGLTANGTYNDAIADDCRGNPRTCTQTGLDNVASAHHRATASTVLFIAGGVVAAGGLVLFFTAPRARSVRVGVAGSSLFAGGSF